MNKRMIEAAVNGILHDFSACLPSDPVVIAQAAIDAAWTEFDLDDPTTHPQSAYAPSGEAWLVVLRGGEHNHDMWRDREWSIFMDNYVTRYADPADFTPSWAKE